MLDPSCGTTCCLVKRQENIKRIANNLSEFKSKEIYNRGGRPKNLKLVL